MKFEVIEEILKKNLKKEIDKTEFKIDNRAKIIITFKKTVGDEYISTTTYYLDDQETHLGTIREIMDRIVVSDIDKYFEENIWGSTSAHGKNNICGIARLVHEIFKIDTMNIIMHPKYQLYQWKSRNPFVSYELLENGTYSAYYKNYKDWIKEGLKKGFVDKEDVTELDKLDVIDNYIHKLNN